jgi:hypothetical protein
MPEAGGDVTRRLGQLRAGNQDVTDQLVPLIYDELLRIAGAQMGESGLATRYRPLRSSMRRICAWSASAQATVGHSC